MINIMESMLNVILRMSPPILMAGLGGLLSSRSGLLNISLEGMLLVGSFIAVLVSFFSGSGFLGLLTAALVGSLIAFCFALFVFKFKANNIVVGVAINMLALGLTTYLLGVIFGVRGGFSSPQIIGLPTIHIPVLREIPILRAFSGQSITVYMAIITVFIMQYILYKTPLGLHIRAAGQNPMAVKTAGINVQFIKYFSLILGGAFCGIGGAHLSLGQLTMFTENMSNGRGYMAMAAAIFGNNTPFGTLIGATLFSFADAVTMRLQSFGVPPQLIQMIPYILTLVILAIVSIRNKRQVKLNRMRLDGK